MSSRCCHWVFICPGKTCRFTGGNYGIWGALCSRIRLLAQGLCLCKDICQRRVLHSVLGSWQRVGARVQLSLLQAAAHPCMVGVKLSNGHELRCSSFDSESQILTQQSLLLALFGIGSCDGVLQHISCCRHIQDCVLNSVELIRKR